nr:protein far1-related sequence 12 [Quercus suber]
MIGSSFEEVSCLGQNNEMTHESSREGGTVVEGDEPYVGREFESEEAAHAFYSAYSMRVGFITRINYLSRSKLDGSVIGRTIVCNKEGYRKAYRHIRLDQYKFGLRSSAFVSLEICMKACAVIFLVCDALQITNLLLWKEKKILHFRCIFGSIFLIPDNKFDLSVSI